MKKITILIPVLLLVTFMLLGCESSVDNKITFLNYAAADVYVSFKGDLIHITPKVPPNEEGVLQIPSGEKVELVEVFKGEYEYESIYSLPVGATSAAAEGEMSGTFKLNAGTKILVIYTSVFDEEGTYTIYASVTTSDDQTVDENPNPIFP